MQGKLVNHFMAQKAGMAQNDKKRIAQTIQKLTAGTPKAVHEQEMQQKRSLQVAEMLKKCLAFTIEQKDVIKKDWWKDMNQMRRTRTLDRHWAHFDFDMFYIACELLDKPDLKEKPCAVGGPNSVLCTANYQARKYGLRAAMPTFIALKLCPEVVLFQPNFPKYKHFSDIFRSMLSVYDPQLQSHGLDQAYIDLTSHLKGKSKEQIQAFISSIRTKIFETTGLTVSCGVGANKMLAKMASQQHKPNGQFILQNNGDKIQTFLADKKLRKIPGIGPVNQYYLKGLGIETAKDILENVDTLTICFSKLSTEFFVSSALGLGSIQHEFKERKSVGKSQTFKTTDDQKFLEDRLKSLCEQVSIQLQELGFVSINVVLSFQNHNFQKRDKTFNLLKYTDKDTDLFEPLITYLKSNKNKYRLLGVKCSSLLKVEEYRKQQLLNYLNNPKKAKEQIEEQKNSVHHIKSMMRSDVIEKGKFLCPICNQFIDCKGNVSMFNKHVDKCLTSIDPQPPSVQINETHTVKKSDKSSLKGTQKPTKAVSLQSFLKKQQGPK